MFFDRPAFLGQAEIRPGSGFGAAPPWSVQSALPRPRMPGAPMTREVISPYGWETNVHCYQCDDGQHRDMTMAEAAAFTARTGVGCRPTYNTACAGSPAAVTTPSTAVAPPPGGMLPVRGAPPGLAASRRMGQNGGPAPSPAPSPGAPQQGVQPITVGTQDQFDFDFFPGFYPYFYPQYYAPQMPAREQIVCRRDEGRSEEEGREVLVCERMAPQYPQYTYPLYQTYPTYWIRPFWF